MFTAVLAEQERSKRDVSTLRTGVVAGSVCPEALVTKMYSDLNLMGLSNVYGMTELSPVTTMMGPSTPFAKKTTTVGHCGPMTEIKILDEAGNIVPVGQKGEVCVRGYLTMLRYWGDPEKTNETIRNGWVHSGDIGTIDEDGFLSIVGRSKDMIIRGGENISPFEIESFFDKRKWVRDIQVVGVKDDLFGEEVAAWIIPDREVTDA
jgi:fatty-acyl-CoA synthase